jgi:hypothetical protein
MHVTPLNDLRPHQESRSCACGPRIENERIVIHHSYDRRELVEQAVGRASRVGVN